MGVEIGVMVGAAGMVVGAVGCVVAGWVLACNRVTCEERKALITVIYRCRNWSDLMRDFDAVSYEQHLYARALLRHPKKLYSRAIGERMGWPA